VLVFYVEFGGVCLYEAYFGALKCDSGFSIWECSRGSVGYSLPSLAVQ
jgi:hypothetical protein